MKNTNIYIPIAGDGGSASFSTETFAWGINAHGDGGSLI